MVIEQEQSTRPSESDRSRRPGVLLVEDEPQLRELIGGFLTARGFTVFSADTGPKALQLWHQDHARNQIEILFTDIVLPGGITGVDLAEQILQEKPDLPIVITSGYRIDSISSAEKIKKFGHFVPKPYAPRTIISLFQKILKL